jgi:hypothetical protein
VKLLRQLSARLARWLIADGCEEADGFHYCRDCAQSLRDRCRLEGCAQAGPGPGLPLKQTDEGC